MLVGRVIGRDRGVRVRPVSYRTKEIPDCRLTAAESGLDWKWSSSVLHPESQTPY